MAPGRIGAAPNARTAVSDRQLVAGLASALGTPDAALQLLERRHYEGGTVAKEVVTVRADAVIRELFCKHGSSEHNPDRSRRRGTMFEAEVYARLAASAPTSPGLLLGTFLGQDGATSLVLEHLANAVRLSEAPAETVEAAAMWLGGFHREWISAIPFDLDPFVHSSEELRTWARQTLDYSQGLHDEYPWIRAVCEGVADAADDLMDGPQCLLHGEFTVHNVLVVGEQVVPVDWEGASVGIGEIDLAMLLERWPDSSVARAAEAYRVARFDAGEHDGIQSARRLDRARLYVTMRWLGDRRSLARRESTRWRYDDLHRHAVAVGLL